MIFIDRRCDFGGSPKVANFGRSLMGRTVFCSRHLQRLFVSATGQII